MLYSRSLWTIFISYLAVMMITVVGTSVAIGVTYAGPSDPGATFHDDFLARLYFSANNVLSPGFSEYVPTTRRDQVLALSETVVGVGLNALFITLLVGRALRPRSPFVVVRFLLYDPERRALVVRFYHRLPVNLYDVQIAMHRFGTAVDGHGDQVGRSVAIITRPSSRQIVRPFYGILVRLSVADKPTDDPRIDNVSGPISDIPVEWLTDRSGHFYLTVSGDSIFGRIYQTVDYFISSDQLKVGKHRLLNDGLELHLPDWYNWRLYRWDMWENYIDLSDRYENDPRVSAIRSLQTPDS